MRIVIGVLCTSLWLVYAGQLVSVANFGLAQRLGLQERHGDLNDLTNRLELWTARFDLLWLWTLPAAGVLMLIDHSWWPYAAMIGGSAYIDGPGRELCKVLGMRELGVWTGTPREFLKIKVVFTAVILLGGVAIAMGLAEVT